MTLSRRHALALTFGSTMAATAATPARAQAWPKRPIRLIVPFSPGTSMLDIMAHLVSKRMAEEVGQEVVVDNLPGAGGVAGAIVAANSLPDGYTVLVANTAMVVSPFLYAKVSFNPLTDFIPVTTLNTAQLILTVNPSLPVKSVKQFIRYAKANSGKLKYSSGGFGSSPFLAVELLKSIAGFDALHVPFRGGAPAVEALAAGEVAFAIESVPITMPFTKDGRVRPLAVTGRRRERALPDIPTMTEEGVEGFDIVISWNGVFLPRDTDPQIAARLHGVLTLILNSNATREQITKMGAEAGGEPPSVFTAFVKAESERWSKIIKERGFKPL